MSSENILEQRRQARIEKSKKDAELMQLHKAVADALSKSGAAKKDKTADELRSRVANAALRTAILRDDADGVALRQNSPFGFLKEYLQ